MTTSTIEITSIIRSAGTQFRAFMDEDNVLDMMDLIERGVSFKTPIRIAEFNGRLYLTDGFHRIEAYSRLSILDIPAEPCVIVPASSIEEVRVMAMGANVAHGKGTTEADYYYIIKKMMDLGDGKYMKNVFEPNIQMIAESIGAAVTSVRRGYSNYKGTKDNPHPSLSQQCKERRDIAILESYKNGKSAYAMAKLFKMNEKTVGNILSNYCKNAESAELQYPELPLSVVPIASTAYRSDTREDADAFINKQLEELLDQEYLNMEGGAELLLNEANVPTNRFDVLAATGYGEGLCQHTKPSKPATEYEQVEAAKANPVKLQEEWMELCDEEEALKVKLAEIIQRKSQVRRIATQCGVALPE
ncbi:TPA: ParB N-terminal domain-containing protein [Aeromonas hydrophila]|nr:ParB N-terminal domain-containing protein [Aeromonas hydrophila]